MRITPRQNGHSRGQKPEHVRQLTGGVLAETAGVTAMGSAGLAPGAPEIRPALPSQYLGQGALWGGGPWATGRKSGSVAADDVGTGLARRAATSKDLRHRHVERDVLAPHHLGDALVGQGLTAIASLVCMPKFP